MTRAGSPPRSAVRRTGRPGRPDGVRTLVRGVHGRRGHQALARPHHHRGRQHVVRSAHEQSAPPAQRRALRGEVHPVQAAGRPGPAGFLGRHRPHRRRHFRQGHRQPRDRADRAPRPDLQRRHALLGIDRARRPRVAAGRPWRDRGGDAREEPAGRAGDDLPPQGPRAQAQPRHPGPGQASAVTAAGRTPLEGLRVLTVSQFGAGPFGTQVLADLGAEVIKIEDSAVGGDVARYVPPWQIEADSLYFQAFNRGKKSVTLNLLHPDGREVFHDLVRVSHAVYNNVRGDLPRKLGLTYEALGAVNRAVDCCSLSGFGSTGPRAAEPGYDYLIQGHAGYMAITGEPDGPPGKCGVSVIDFAGGYASMLALMVGLWDAQRTGVGRNLDVSLLDTAVSMLSYFATWTLNRGWEPERVADSGHQTLVPSQNFRTADGWIVVFCAKEKFWLALVEAMDLGHLARDPRFATFADRLRHKAALLALLRPRFHDRTTAEWLTRLRGRVPCAPVNTVRQALEDEQVRAREMIVEVEHPEYGVIREVASPIRTAGAVRRPAPAPRLGEHTEQVLRDVLMYPSARIATLRASGALGGDPRSPTAAST